MAMRKKLLGIVMGVLMLAGAAMPATVFADNAGGGGGTATSKCNGVKFLGMDPWFAGLDCDSDGNIAQSNFESGRLSTTVMVVIATVVKDLMFIGGMLAVVLVMYGGFLMVTSQGNPGAVEKAKKTISGAIIGLIIAILAYAIATTVLKVVTGA